MDLDVDRNTAFSRRAILFSNSFDPYSRRINSKDGALSTKTWSPWPCQNWPDSFPHNAFIGIMLAFPIYPRTFRNCSWSSSWTSLLESILFSRRIIFEWWHRSRICLLLISSYIHRNTISLQSVSGHAYPAFDMSNIPFLLGAFCKPTHFKWNHSREQDSMSHPTISP